MEQLIPIASKLQDVFGALGQSTTIDLPQVVVIGSQSSGKSSVLESIVGRSFLPRGSGICTRRPLVLQLFNTSPHAAAAASDGIGSDGLGGGEGDGELELRPGDEWGEFLHMPGKRLYDFNAIRSEIVRETERSTGKNKGISAHAIHLKICSPRVLHLTMVDLPGITKVAVGDQPEDIEVQIRAMCLNYISNPNAILLAVTAGNTDLANSDALQMARSVDPDGNRTIGVVTKVDLMDSGTDATEILQNRLVPLRRGYIAVMNRGQADIVKDVTIRVGLRKEMEFFRSHPAYRHLQHRCGTSNLAKSLNGILMHHIRDCLPEIKNRILNMMTDIQLELEAFGSTSHDKSGSVMGGEMLRLLSKFSSNFAACIEGKGTSSEGAEMNELYGGARISFIFNDVFARSLMAVDPFDGLSDDEIRTTICNANGPRRALFVPEISFDLLVRRQISRLEQPGLQCVDLVFDELQRMASQCEPTEFQRFPELRERMVETATSLLRRCVQPTQLMISNLVKIELSYINTSHPDFIGGSKAVARLMGRLTEERERTTPQGQRKTPKINGSKMGESTSADLTSHFDAEHEDLLDDEHDGGLLNFIFRGKKDQKRVSNGRGFRSPGPPSIVQLPQVPDTMRQTDLPTDRERIETEIIKSLIESYFCIVRKNFIDMVPKTIMYFLVNHSRDSMQNELVSELYREANIADLMREAEDIAQRRKTCHEMRELLRKALDIVNEVRDFNTFK